MWQGLNRKGKKVTLLNPNEKASKFAFEISQKKRVTNDMTAIKGGLNKEQQAYRAGYLDARKDSAKAYNHNLKKKSAKKNTRKKSGSKQPLEQIVF